MQEEKKKKKRGWGVCAGGFPEAGAFQHLSEKMASKSRAQQMLAG